MISVSFTQRWDDSLDVEGRASCHFWHHSPYIWPSPAVGGCGWLWAFCSLKHSVVFIWKNCVRARLLPPPSTSPAVMLKWFNATVRFSESGFFFPVSPVDVHDVNMAEALCVAADYQRSYEISWLSGLCLMSMGKKILQHRWNFIFMSTLLLFMSSADN